MDSNADGDIYMDTHKHTHSLTYLHYDANGHTHTIRYATCEPHKHIVTYYDSHGHAILYYNADTKVYSRP